MDDNNEMTRSASAPATSVKILRDTRCWPCVCGEHLYCERPQTCRCYWCYAAEIKQEDARVEGGK